MRTLLNSIALEPNRWTPEKIPAHDLARDLLPRIRAAGFRHVEVWQYHVSRKSLDETRALRESAEGLGLDFPIVGAYPVLHLGGAEGEKARAENRGVIERAEALGAQWIKFFLGRVKGSEINPSQLARTTANLTEWVEYGHRKHIRFCAELHPGTLFDPFDFGRRYLLEHPDLDVQICFQPYDGRDTEAALRLVEILRGQIVHLHLQGHNAGGHCRLEEAALDYRRLIPAIAKHNPEARPSVEFVPGGFPKEGEPFDFDAALADAVADAKFVEGVWPA